MLNNFARFAPRRTSQREKRVQGILRKHMSIMKLGRAKMTELFQDRKIDNQIADRDSDARFALFRLKDAEWEILDGKMRIGWNFDKTAQGQSHQPDLTTKGTKATKKIKVTLRNLCDLRVLRGDLEKPEGAQIFARLIEAATTERRNESPAILQPFDVDLPFAPREKILGKRK